MFYFFNNISTVLWETDAFLDFLIKPFKSQFVVCMFKKRHFLKTAQSVTYFPTAILSCSPSPFRTNTLFRAFTVVYSSNKLQMSNFFNRNASFMVFHSSSYCSSLCSFSSMKYFDKQPTFRWNHWFSIFQIAIIPSQQLEYERHEDHNRPGNFIFKLRWVPTHNLSKHKKISKCNTRVVHA